MPVEREPWKEPSDVEDAVAAPREDLHTIVEPLDTSARLPVLNVVRHLVHPPIDGPKNTLELRKAAACTRLSQARIAHVAPAFVSSRSNSAVRSSRRW